MAKDAIEEMAGPGKPGSVDEPFESNAMTIAQIKKKHP
jgi:hypothetical protein